VDQKIWNILYALIVTSSNIDQLSKTFITVRIRRKFAIISLKIPPHLKFVATLPCEKQQYRP